MADISTQVSDALIRDAIERHDDPEHEDALSVDDVRELLGFIQDGVTATWENWMDNIEEGHADVVHDGGDVLVLATGQHDAIREELSYYDGEIVVDETAGSVISAVHHTLAREHCEYSWSTSFPIVVFKPDNAQDGERYVQAIVNGLLRRGLSPGQAWSYYGVKICGHSRNHWASRCGYSDHSAVSEALRKATQKASLPL